MHKDIQSTWFNYLRNEFLQFEVLHDLSQGLGGVEVAHCLHQEGQVGRGVEDKVLSNPRLAAEYCGHLLGRQGAPLQTLQPWEEEKTYIEGLTKGLFDGNEMFTILLFEQAGLNLPMLRLPSSKGQGGKDFWKPSKCHIGIH